SRPCGVPRSCIGAVSMSPQADAPRELLIPLDLPLEDAPIEAAFKRRVEWLVRTSVGRVAGLGWQSDGPLDWDTLLAAGRLRVRTRTAWLGLLGHYELAAVALPLRRAPGHDDLPLAC